MAALPEFILRKFYLPGSYRKTTQRFWFSLENSFAPATIHSFQIELDGKLLPPESIQIQPRDGEPVLASSLSAAQPLAFSIWQRFDLSIDAPPPAGGQIKLLIETREAGSFSFNLPLRAKHAGQPARSIGPLPRLFNQPLRASMAIDAREVVGEINPFVYGQFIEHLEDCLYGGIWSPDGSQFNQPVIDLIQDLHPPVIRYPGGNFASGYHWEDGIGPRDARPARFDQAWNAPESNQVGTDEFMALCKLAGAAPFLVVNDGSGSPEEAARWVAYCNEPPDAPQGKRRAHNAGRAPYGVRLWGVGNEVWGRWQIGHTGPEQYTERLLAFSRAMRQTDPEIELVAVGDTIRSDEPQDPGRLWNQTVLRQAADQIDYLSFHLYQPDRDGWQEQYDLDELHHTVCAAPLDAERMIARLAAQIEQEAPGRAIKIAFDEWNIWLPPPEGASSMHKVLYTMRDGLYAASMLNAFHRQCNLLAIANLAQLVNILPLIYARPGQAYPTPLYFPFRMYRQMQPLALRAEWEAPTYHSSALGNIAAQPQVPYLDATATCNPQRSRLAIGLVNRHPRQQIRVRIGLDGFPPLHPVEASLLQADTPLAANTFSAPERVRDRAIDPLPITGGQIDTILPASSVMVLVYGSG